MTVKKLQLTVNVSLFSDGCASGQLFDNVLAMTTSCSFKEEMN